jgi:NNP family nitrate/nitrite transporter-like MFS transporter
MNDASGNGERIGAQRTALAFIFSIFFANMLSRLGLAPLLPAIEQDLALSHAEAGSVFLFVSIGYGAGLFASTFVSARISHQYQIGLSSLAVGASLMLLSRCDALWSLRASLGVLGVAGGLYLPSGVAVLTVLIRKRDWGKVLAMHQLAPNLAYICSPLLAQLLTGWLSWQLVLTLYGLFSMAVGAAFVLKGTGTRSYGDTPSLTSFRNLIAKPDIWILIFLFSLAIGVNQGLFSMLPLYLTAERGIEAGTANRLLSLSRLIAFGTPLLAGWLSDNWGLTKMLFVMIVASALGTFAVAMVPNAWMALGLVLQAVTAVCFFPLGFSALSNISSPGNRNLVVALTIPFGYLAGAGLIPTIIGVAGDAGNFNWGLYILGALTFGGAFLLKFLFLEGNK